MTQEHITPGLCQCGCGTHTPLYARDSKVRGYRKGEPTRYITGHQIRGRRPHNHGHRSAGRYVRVECPDHPAASADGFTYEHRIVAEAWLGRYLRTGEVVHHRDGNKSNNDPCNLFVFPSQSEHMSMHQAKRRILREMEREAS